MRSDAIIATGRSDYPNQVNNVLGFPYIFRGALDVRASTINDAMKIAAAEALAAARPRGRARRGRGRLCRRAPAVRAGLHHPGAVRSAPDLGRAVRGRQGGDGFAASRASRSSTSTPTSVSLRARLDPTAAGLELIFEKVRAQPKRVVFAEGEEEKTIRAALLFAESGYGTPVLVGREERIQATMSAIGSELARGPRDPQRSAVAP